MYNIKAVSKMVDIPAVTIRAWERRYNVINPERTEGRQRLYSDEDVANLKWLKEQSEQHGISISQAAKLLIKKNQDTLSLSSRPLEQGWIANNYEDIIKELYKELLDINVDQANYIVEKAFSMFHYKDVFYKILAPICHQAGKDWEANIVTIAQEHLITDFVIQRFYQIFKILPINHRMPQVLTACPPGETHLIGLFMFTLFIREKGMPVISLGANTPVDGLRSIIIDKDLRYMCMSLTNKDHLNTAVLMIDELHVEFPQLQFVLGGQGFKDLPEHLNKYRIGSTVEDWERWFKLHIS